MELNKENKKELLELYKRAKEAYYTGEEIMSDLEFDELEEFLGLSNKSSIGTRRNENYTVKHPVVMGSLSKVQVKEDSNGFIDWEQILKNTKSYISKKKAKSFIVTPKFDGLSFEAVINNGNIISISSRGDGEFGQDWTIQLKNKVESCLQHNYTNYILRGEVLINKNTYLKKYTDVYANPRSFVSGVMGRDYNTDADYLQMLADIDIVVYDFKVINDESIIDYDWTVLENKTFCPDCHLIFNDDELTVDKIQTIYNIFAIYRKECKYALDGYVIKPTDKYRISDFNAHRPKDCVAIKFKPMLQETEIVDISWKLSEKTGELIPTIITNPVIMDGKSITRASASNYGKLINEKLSIGTKVILSLAGDIIPFIYKITDTSAFDENKLNIPTEYTTYIEEGGNGKSGSVKRLKVVLSEDDKRKANFIASISNLNIANLGPALAVELYNYLVEKNNDTLTSDFFGIEPTEIPDNVLLVSPEDIALGIGGKNGEKIKKEFENALRQLSLKEIILSCNFAGCGSKIAEQCYLYLSGQSYDFSHLSENAYKWVFDKTSDNYMKLDKIVKSFGKEFNDFVPMITEEEKKFIENQIPVILTGEPNDYTSKGEFLKLHPEYRMTGSWKEVKIVFTNSLESNTGKMKKAREKGIEIKLY